MRARTERRTPAAVDAPADAETKRKQDTKPAVSASPDLGSHALEYAKAGFPIFPVGLDKEPLIAGGVKAATTNLLKITDWWTRFPEAGIGFSPGDRNWMVVDLDPGADPAELERRYGKLATPLKQTTPRGGEHLFFELAATDKPVGNSASKVADHVDIRGLFGYVLLAPSRAYIKGTKDIGSYEWQCDWRKANPAFRPASLYAAAEAARERHPEANTWIIEADLPENVAACIEWLKRKAEPAAEGKGGDNMAFKTAAMCHSYGISAPLALELMLEHYNPRCLPPWSPDQLGHFEAKVEHAYSYHTSPPGNLTPAYRRAKDEQLFKPKARTLVEGEEGIEWTAGRFRIVDDAAIKLIKPPAWLVDNVVPEEGFAILFGAPGTFKTFVALDIAMNVASIDWEITGGLWTVKKPGSVLYSAGEGRPGVARRMEAWKRRWNHGERVRGMLLGDPVPNVAEELDPWLKLVDAAAPNGLRLVVIDTIGRAMQGANENSQEHASKFTRMVERIQRELGAAVLALHHSGHNEKGRGKGSMEFMGAPDTLLGLERDGKALDIEMHLAKQKDAPEWETSLKITLREVDMQDGERPCLVAGPSEKADGATRSDNDATPGPSRRKNDPRRSEDDTIMTVLDRAVVEEIERYFLKVWTQTHLANVVATRDDIDVGSHRLRTVLLTKLREWKPGKARRYYDAPSGVWRSPRMPVRPRES